MKSNFQALLQSSPFKRKKNNHKLCIRNETDEENFSKFEREINANTKKLEQAQKAHEQNVNLHKKQKQIIEQNINNFQQEKKCT